MYFKGGKSKIFTVSPMLNQNKLNNSSSMLGQNKGQITLFIIIAIFIIAGTVLFFMFRGSFGFVQIPPNLQPVYDSFLSCLQDEISVGIDVLESQAGYIFLPDFEPGSSYMPFSSQLDFLGSAVPYWYYVSGNNIQREQIPSKSKMEKDLAEFIETEIIDCDFDRYYEDGFNIKFGEPKVNTEIRDERVEISLEMNMGIEKGGDSVVVKNHKTEIESELGKLYDSAKEVYKYEQDTLFLENYAIDILRLYAPVDGVELSCSPLTWNAEDIFDDLAIAIESNTFALNVIEGENDYFELDLPVNQEVRFINSRNWPNGFEVNPSEESILIANTVGNQPGLGALGFCYAPYHFVYNLRYPILVQIYGEEEVFQFPLAVVIQGNMPREALDTSALDLEIPPLCEQQNIPVKVNVYDTELNPIDKVEISYKCSGTKCDIGETEFGFLEEDFPQCVNGFLIAKAEGYEQKSELYSVVSSGEASIILDKLYELNVDLKLDNSDYNGQATITFNSENGVKTIVYPDQKTVELSEGQYEVQVYIYKNSSITIGKTTTRKCFDVPQSGLGGFFGFTKEQCFNFDFPEQIISNALGGGGKQNYFILESELKDSNTMEINTGSLPIPRTLDQLQDNYVLFEDRGLTINFK